MAGALLDVEALTALGAEPFDRLIPSRICDKVMRLALAGENKVFVIGSLLDDRSDFLLDIIL
jgi:hypothetical protein